MSNESRFRSDLWDSMVLNQEVAKQVIEAVDDPVVRELLRKTEGALFMRFFHKMDVDDEEYQKTLPNQPFDMLFYIQLCKTVLSKKEGIKYLLEHGPDDTDELFALWFG